jgi:heptaprenyl diphosphate synthase
MDLNKTVLENIQIQLNNSLSHPYLLEKINTYTYDSELIKLLFNLLSEKGFDEKTLSNYIEAIMLNYIALKTHDKIENTHLGLETKQLTILAGAYYTGLYYLKLSKLQDIELIENLSIAIQEQSEIKADIKVRNYESINDLFNDIANIEWSIFKHVINSLRIHNYNEKHIKETLLKIRLKEEVFLLNKDIITFINIQFMKFYDNNKTKINNDFKTWIDSTVLI